MSEGADDLTGDDLPEPHNGMTPEEKGELLIQYLRAKARLVVARLTEVCRLEMVRRDFSEAHLEGADLSDANLDWVDLRRAVLRGAVLSGAWANRATFAGADLRGARLINADLNGSDLSGADLRGADFAGTDIDAARVRGAPVDFVACERSGWSAGQIKTLEARGAILDGVADAIAALWIQPGLTLYLSTRLLPWDQTMLHAFACSVLGTDTDVHVAEYTETGEGCRVRLVGSNPEDLDTLAEHISRVSWRADAQAALAAAGVQGAEPSLDFIRTHLDKQERWGPDETKGGAPVVLQRSWDADLLQATLTYFLERTGMKGLLEVGARTATRLLTNAAAAKDEADVARWEASIARQELAEEVVWEVRRLDDNGNEFVMSRHWSSDEADAKAAEMEARGHKQTYWVTRSGGRG